MRYLQRVRERGRESALDFSQTVETTHAALVFFLHMLHVICEGRTVRSGEGGRGGVLSASKVRADDADGVVSAFARHVHEDVLV